PRSLPLWLPPAASGMMRRSNARYREAGGILRPMRTTVDLTRDDEIARGVDRPRRAGLTRDEEAELLRAYPGG
ncbi:MAG: reductase, partial [Propionibacterium sp.]|nr:reductase [Propionibacterium sp.]